MSEQRKAGWYWVRQITDQPWMVHEWMGDHWLQYRPGTDWNFVGPRIPEPAELEALYALRDGIDASDISAAARALESTLSGSDHVIDYMRNVSRVERLRRIAALRRAAQSSGTAGGSTSAEKPERQAGTEGEG